MGITVYEAMKIGGLQKATLLGGKKGLDKVIEYISYAETPRVTKYLKGQELMLSAFYAMKKDVDQQLRVLEGMHIAGSSALVISYPEIWGKISPLLIRKADEYEIPLLSIPQDVSYADIITPISRAIGELRTEQLEFLNNLHSAFSHIVLENRDLGYFADQLRKLTQLPVLLLSPEMRLMVNSGWNKDFICNIDHENIIKELKKESCFVCQMRTVQEKRFAHLFPVMVNGKLEGSVGLVSAKEDISEYRRLAGEQAAIIYGWYILKNIAIKNAIAEKDREFLDLLLSDPPYPEEFLQNRGSEINLDIKSSHCIGIIDASRILDTHAGSTLNVQKTIKSCAKSTFLGRFPYSITVQQANRTVLLLSILQENEYTDVNKLLKQTATIFCEKLASCYPQILSCTSMLSIGFGRDYESFSQLRMSYKEAVTAMELANNTSEIVLSKIVHIDDVEEYAFLYEVRQKAPMYLKQTLSELSRLRQLDEDNETNLFDTLKVLFLTKQNTNKTADSLFIHRNTIAYRKEKIKKILSCDPFADENRFRFELALKIYLFGD